MLVLPTVPDAVLGHGVLVGFSGGLDSTVLLHRLAGMPALHGHVRAVHVHHGLQADADGWARHCAQVCDRLGVPLEVVRVAVDPAARLGPEGAARAARHRAFADLLRAGETLALAHHRRDQAETFLLRALRGSGVEGLAAMRDWRAYAAGYLWRPLLAIDRDALAAYADAHGLAWVEDPSNAWTDADRNFLRHRILPLLRERWPSADARLAGSAAIAGAAADLLAAEDTALLASVTATDGSLAWGDLVALPAARRARLLRRWIDKRGLPPLPGWALVRIETEWPGARADAQPVIDWAGARLQRWRGRLYAATRTAGIPAEWATEWTGDRPLRLPDGGTLALHGADRFAASVRVHARRGGERITLPGRRHSHALKDVLQSRAMPPWRRAQLPLVSRGDEVLAAGDSIVSASLQAWLDARGARLAWTPLA